MRTQVLHEGLAAEVELDPHELPAALIEHPLLVLRDLRLSPSEVAELAALFGRLDSFPEGVGLPECPQVVRLSNRSSQGRAAVPYWHTDGLLRSDPPRTTVFYAERVPERDGDTLFTNACDAFDALDEQDRELLRGLVAVMETGVRQPLVRRHPVTGREALSVNLGRTVGIVGVTRDSARGLLVELSDHFDRPGGVYRHRYRPGDLLVWDDVAAAHSATDPVDPRFERSMLRVDVGA